LEPLTRRITKISCISIVSIDKILINHCVISKQVKLHLFLINITLCYLLNTPRTTQLYGIISNAPHALDGASAVLCRYSSVGLHDITLPKYVDSSVMCECGNCSVCSKQTDFSRSAAFGLYCLKCTKFGQLILREIVKIVATRCHISFLTLNCNLLESRNTTK